MKRNNPSDSPWCSGKDADGKVPEADLSPDAHDLREANHQKIFELTKLSVYFLTSECKHCSREYYGHDVVGTKIETESDLRIATYELYEAFYDEPRSISFPVFQSIVASDDPSTNFTLAEFLSAAVDLGYEDATSGREKRSQNEVFERVLPEELRGWF